MHKSMRTSLLLACLTVFTMALCGAAHSENLPIVSEWGRFEQSFRSSSAYSNALQQAALTVVFTSPLGETNPVYGFWDGGRTWRVRFSPDQPGRWSYTTLCSDPANDGLLRQRGAFLCTAAVGTNRFRQHGSVRIARDHRHFEHADGTPFFWLADSAWNGARLSDPKDWEMYARIRSIQKFSAVQWSVAPGQDWRQQSASTAKDQIAINPGFFQRLDAKVDALNQAGLLSVIVPFSGTDPLPGKGTGAEAVSLLRYMVARWGANNVAWLLMCDGRAPEDVARWKQVGRVVFGEDRHAPVVLLPGEEAFDQFRNEHWVDAFGYVTDWSDKSALGSGALANEWGKEPARPVINIEPTRENMLLGDHTRVTAKQVRRAAWLSVLLTRSAGVGYSAENVANWNPTIEQLKNGPPGSDLPVWQKSLFLPGARQMSRVADFFNSIEFWRLVPTPQSLAEQPGMVSPHRYIAAAGTEAKDLELVYVPEDRTVKVWLDALPGWPAVGWMNPQTGEKSPAVAAVEGRTCQFPTPDPDDWLLVIKAGN